MNFSNSIAASSLNVTKSAFIFEDGDTSVTLTNEAGFSDAGGESENVTNVAACVGVTESVFFWYWPILLVFAVTAVIGNIAVLQAILFTKRFYKPENFMLANLCINSLIAIAMTLGYTVLKKLPLIPYNPCVCQVIGFSLQITMPVEAFTLMCMSQERARIVTRPLERESSESSRRKIMYIWLISALLTIPGGFLASVHDETKKGFLKCRWGYQYFGSSLAFIIVQAVYILITQFLPSFVMMTDFCHLVRKLKFLFTCQVDGHRSEFAVSRQKLIRNGLIFTSYFFLIRIPTAVHIYLSRLPPEFRSTEMYCWLRSSRRFWESLFIFHLCFYPLVVFVLSTAMREHLLCCEMGRCEARERLYEMREIRRRHYA